MDSTSDSTAEKATSDSWKEYIDPAAEKRLVRKIDTRFLPIAAFTYFLCFLDRSNIGNARIAGLEEEIGLTGYDFNLGASLFYLFFGLGEIPCVLLVKKLGFVVVPAMTVAFGIVTLATTWLENRSGFFAVRCMLGVAESATLPGLTYVISRFYRRHEVTTRIGTMMLGAAGFAQSFGGLIASGILHVGQVGSVRGWRAIFLVEGIITVGAGILLFFIFPSDPATTRMFNEEEKKLAVLRYKIDQPSNATIPESARWRIFKKVFNVNCLVSSYIYICDNVTVQGLSIFTPTILRLNYPDYTTVNIQLLSVPPAAVGAIVAMISCYIAMKTKRHGIMIIIGASLSILGYGIWTGTDESDIKIRYAAVFFSTCSGFIYGPIVIGWAMANASPDTVRAVTGAMVTGLGNIGSIVATWSYLPTDAHTGYRIACILNLSTAASVIALVFLLWYYQSRENKFRDKGGRDYRLNEENPDELGFHHPNFRYIH